MHVMIALLSKFLLHVLEYFLHFILDEADNSRGYSLIFPGYSNFYSLYYTKVSLFKKHEINRRFDCYSERKARLGSGGMRSFWKRRTFWFSVYLI